MAHVANSHGSMYNGVSQQPPQMRSPSQVEESYNINHSLEYGLIRREPLEQPDGSKATIPVMSNVYEDSYSNMIVDGKAVYQININNGIPMVVQLEPHYKVLRVGGGSSSGRGGITISRDASWYLKQKNDDFKRTQYSTTTIKNTTLIANDAVIPKTTTSHSEKYTDKYALVWFKHADAAMGIDYKITIDGKTYKTVVRDRGPGTTGSNKTWGQPTSAIGGISGETYYPWPSQPFYSGGSIHWNEDLKVQVRVGTTTPVYIYLYSWYTAAEISAHQAYIAAVDARSMAMADLERAKTRRILLERQQDMLNRWVNQDVKGPTTTKDACDELYKQIEKDYTVYRDGSMMEIQVKGKDISVSDSFGNTAMALFYKEIPGIEALPQRIKNTWKAVKFKVKQESTSDKAAFWVKWNGSIWEEHQDDYKRIVTDKTLPIEMKTTFTESGSIDKITIGIRNWSNRQVGDSHSNPGPKFFNRKPIRDIFFYRNRIGFLTDEGISMTESGSHSNLWRTTALATLDSDPIDFVVSTTSSTALRHTIMNQDKVFILADNVQFVMDGGAVFSPKSVKVNEVSHYVLNLDIQPIVTDNKIVFMGGTDKSAIVYEYAYNEGLGIAEANALTSHVPGYILNDVTCLAASNEDNMIFVVASDHRERLLPRYDGDPVFRDMYDGQGYIGAKSVSTHMAYADRKILYVYKSAESGGKKVQSAWSKWNYRGSVLQVAGARGMLYMDIDHEKDFDQTQTTIGTGIWEMTGAWDHQNMNWNMSEDDYLDNVQLQRRFARQALTPPFIEAVTGEYRVSASILGIKGDVIHDYRDFDEYVNRSWLDVGEFVFKDRASKMYTASKCTLKQCNIKSDPGSLHTLVVRNMDTGKAREILPKDNKRFKGIGLAGNYFSHAQGRTDVWDRLETSETIFDGHNILKASNIPGTRKGLPNEPGGNLIGGFDSAEIGKLNFVETRPIEEKRVKPHLYGVDVPVMIGGRSDSTRVVISSYADSEKDYGFRIHDIIQEASVSQRYNLS